MKPKHTILLVLLFLVTSSYHNVLAALSAPSLAVQSTGACYKKEAKKNIDRFAHFMLCGDTKSAEREFEIVRVLVNGKQYNLQCGNHINDLLEYIIDKHGFTDALCNVIKFLVVALPQKNNVKKIFESLLKQNQFTQAKALLPHVNIDEPRSDMPNWLPLGLAVQEDLHKVIIFLVEEADADWDILFEPHWQSVLDVARRHYMECFYKTKTKRHKARKSINVLQRTIAQRKRAEKAALILVLGKDCAGIVQLFLHKSYPTFDFETMQWVSDKKEETAVEEAAEKLEALQISQ